MLVSDLSNAQNSTDQIVIAATLVLDGKGNRIENTRIVIKDGIIMAIDPKAQPIDFDLRGLTVLPGWIDAHTHISWSFGKDGKNAGNQDTTQWGAIAAASNAYYTLMGGFTTIQSVGSKFDLNLRDAIDKGVLPGPRILTSLDPITISDQTPDELRALVIKRKQEGANLIKIMALGNTEQPTSSDKLFACCDEAKKQGLRTLVHANAGDARVAALVGCTQVEHGREATTEELKVLATKGTYFDPQGGLLMENIKITGRSLSVRLSFLQMKKQC